VHADDLVPASALFRGDVTEFKCSRSLSTTMILCRFFWALCKRLVEMRRRNEIVHLDDIVGGGGGRFALRRLATTAPRRVGFAFATRRFAVIRREFLSSISPRF